MIEEAHSFLTGDLLVANSNLFKWRNYQAEIILLHVCRYLRYALSYCDLERIRRERGLTVDHATIFRSRAVLSPTVGEEVPP